MLKFERLACSLADKVCAVSEEDARLLRARFKLTNVCGAVPTGVGLDFFQLSAAPCTLRSLVFLGSMDWMPNIDGCVWFADEMWPLVKQKFPDATLTIVGRKPAPKVLELAARDASIKVTGTVDEVRPHLAAGEVMVVPLRVGGGTRIKIFEAIATGIPCVSTRIGAEGLPVNHGEHIALADRPADFARETGALFGQNARDLVEKNFGWPGISAVLSVSALRPWPSGSRAGDSLGAGPCKSFGARSSLQIPVTPGTFPTPWFGA